jgi:hypothetical protein
MDVAAILALVTKGISIANALITAGQSAAPAFAALQNLFKGKATITQADMDSTDAVLDALLDDFNLELPPP